MIRTQLFNILNNEQTKFDFLIANNLLQSEHICSKCGARKQIIDLINRRCNLRYNGIKCLAQESIFKNSIFENAKIDVSTVLFLLYEWCVNILTCDAAVEYNCSQSTVSIWYKKFRAISVIIYNTFLNEPIGGENIIVQIDETCLVKNKYHQGRILSNQKWIFAGVVLGDHSKCFFEYVVRRNEETLLDVIRRKILPGTIIMSDMWGGYQNIENRLPEYGYRHFTVNHSENFVNPITGAHTQSIESFWSVTKRNLRKKGTNNGEFEEIQNKIKENLFKTEYKLNKFEKMIEMIGHIYED